MRTLLRHVRSQLVAYLALFIALGGTGYAAINLPANSVGSRQLKRGAVATNQLRNHSVTPIKLAKGSIAGYIRAYAEVNPGGAVVASSPRAQTIGWRESGPTPGGIISFKGLIPSSCFALATTTGQLDEPVYASAMLSQAGTRSASVAVDLSTPPPNGSQPTDVNVAVLCAQP